MADTAALPYVDLGNSVDVLRQYAQDHFGKRIPATAKDETVRDRFAAIYFEETGVKLAKVDIVADEPDALIPDEPKKRKPTHATIIVQDDEKDPGAVSASHNFVAFRIQRNVEVKVNISQLESLQHAKRTIYHPDTMEPKDVLSYPFSIVEYHYED